MYIFSDITYQEGWLANPMQRVYFADKSNFYIGEVTDIKDYTSSNNNGVFQLADDIERLPDNRLKIPVGLRFNYYINEYFVLRTYYRYYFDDWGLTSNTINLELPVKLSASWTIYPSYRFYQQGAADYFAPYETHLSTETYYTSDYDLAQFKANQFGIGIQYADLLNKNKLWRLGLKQISLHYAYYQRSNELQAQFINLGMKFLLSKRAR